MLASANTRNGPVSPSRTIATYAILIAIGWATARVSAAARGPDASAAVAGTIEVFVRTVTDETPLHGTVVALNTSDGLTLATADGEHRRVPLPDLVRVTTSTTATLPQGPALAITLTNGDRLFGELGSPEEGAEASDSVTLDIVDVGRIVLSLEVLTLIDTQKAVSPAFRKSVRWLDGTQSESDDRILLTNGDVVRGYITAIDTDGFHMEGPLGQTTVPHRVVVAARFAAATSEMDPSDVHMLLTTRTHSRLTVSQIDWSGDAVRATLSYGQRVQFDAKRLVRVEVVGGRWEWLSNHQPISAQQTPMLTLGWDHAVDRNVLGDPIVVAGKRFERGVGVHSRSRLTYDLKGEYRRFESRFGIDDDSGPFADVSVAVLVDGQQRFEQHNVRRGTLHDSVILDVSRANRIELLVDFGANGDLQDRFDWVEPALIR